MLEKGRDRVNMNGDRKRERDIIDWERKIEWYVNRD